MLPIEREAALQTFAGENPILDENQPLITQIHCGCHLFMCHWFWCRHVLSSLLLHFLVQCFVRILF